MSRKAENMKEALQISFIGRNEYFWGIMWNEAGDESHFRDFPDYSGANCTGYACAIVKRLGHKRTKIFGFYTMNNPGTVIERVTEGHDFVVVDGRYIVDPWVATTLASSNGQGVFDLQDPSDKILIKQIYGDQKLWDDGKDIIEYNFSLDKA